ncbi:MAG TPA: ThiF family adenylyltransferase [Thermoanaerobaculia bacterium]
MLISKLTIAADDTTGPPADHVAYFIGDYPCRADGTPIEGIRHKASRTTLTPDLVADHSFSSKPQAGRYADYYEKMTTYASIIASQAQAIDPELSPKTFPVITTEEEESVFCYIDTASSRAGIAAVSTKLETGPVAIVGLGGTGSYVLDLLAKTPVREIHLYDRDTFSQHNAFRSPGAPTAAELQTHPTKVEHFSRVYSAIRRRISPHPYHITDDNSDELREFTFVFLCMDGAGAKKAIIDKLVVFGIPFIDVGMGVDLIEGKLGGILRVTTSTPDRRDHIDRRISFGANDDEYATNIQVADLNALNAALAVIRWKKHLGFYRDERGEHHTTYTISANMLLSEET